MIADIVAFVGANRVAISTLSALAGGAFALWRYYADQKWKKLQFAYDYAEKMFDDPRIMTALNMIDWQAAKFPADVVRLYDMRDSDTHWTYAEVCAALRPHDARADASNVYSRKEYAIRSMFDRFFAAMERLGTFEKQGIIDAAAFPTALAYYAVVLSEPRLADLRLALFAYMNTYRFTAAATLFEKLARSRKVSLLEAYSG